VGRPWSLWADAFGALAIRAVQIIVVVALAAGIIWGIRQLTVVTIPLVIALILASAFAPLMGWLRGRGILLVATLITLFAIALVLTAVGWLIVWAVRDQWDELATQAQGGFTDLMAWAGTLPFQIDHAQIDEWLKTLTDFVTSAQFGSGASPASAPWPTSSPAWC
jgi:predicted PurR-regulated permease PerM